jgi:CheY-like chemotaxis protein
MAASPEQRAGTVLIVDDSPGTLGFLTEALERERFTVLVALRGERALATVQQMRPDLVLMDAVMPELDGFETCRRLKRMPGAETIPVIFMTGLSDTDHVIRGLESGGVDYVTKPVVPQELVARIRVHLAGVQLVASAHAAIDAAGHALFAAGADGKLRWATPAAARLLTAVLPPGGRNAATARVRTAPRASHRRGGRVAGRWRRGRPCRQPGHPAGGTHRAGRNLAADSPDPAVARGSARAGPATGDPARSRGSGLADAGEVEPGYRRDPGVESAHGEQASRADLCEIGD